ncbi:phosphoribosylaminoimidazolesuccinocarboxamide synthase [Candidatus Poribacteria bacterium]|nr:phosphoribosylaminoimidazolesuccinocarboxamide synthase [Candidatus Poribacteria bacterium]
MARIVLESSCPDLKLAHRGKVRDVYDLGAQLLIVATDRISAFDCVLPNAIPDKGRTLTALSEFWFGLIGDIVPNHLISTRIADFPPVARQYADQLEGRSMLVHRAQRVDSECVVRGYLSGSGWREYRASGTVCGARLPSGLRESDRLPESIFTPATKEDSGHDENISVERMRELVGDEVTDALQRTSIAVYERAAAYALERGIIIADTKFEFGYRNGELILIDEVLTPDSSRFWPVDDYAPGRSQASFDKQYVRDYLETLDWGKQPPAPPLTDEVVAGTSARYREAYQRLVGSPL